MRVTTWSSRAGCLGVADATERVPPARRLGVTDATEHGSPMPRREGTRRLLAMTLLVTLVAGSAGAADRTGVGAGAFLRAPMGARSMGMGGPHVALGGDVHGYLANPALLSTCGKLRLAAGQLWQDVGDAGAIDPQQFFVSSLGLSRSIALGFMYVGHNVEGILAADERAPLEGDNEFTFGENAFSLGLALSPGGGDVTLGIAFRRLNQVYDKIPPGTGYTGETEVGAFGIELGLFARLTEAVSVGGHLSKSANVDWGSQEDLTPKVGAAGIAIEPRAGLLFAMDLRQVEQRPLMVSVGGEYALGFGGRRGKRTPVTDLPVNLRLRAGFGGLYLVSLGGDHTLDVGKCTENEFVFTAGTGLVIKRQETRAVLLDFGAEFGGGISRKQISVEVGF